MKTTIRSTISAKPSVKRLQSLHLSSVPLVVLSNIRDSQTLRNRLIDALEFLDQHGAELTELQAARRALNRNLQKLLETGWLEVVKYVYDATNQN